MERIWLKQYPPGIPADVDVHAFASLKDILATSCQRFADLPAYGNMGVSISYRELDALSRDFAAYLQKVAGLKKGDRLGCPICCSTRLRCSARSGPAWWW